ncbi:MAG: hypothetical protein IPO09_13680 [Anaeromyxobacter sp.]|nr:hypothetical protein [Anaeromyxobacter sp.]MBL0275236.1 hypothetical protein [Anaeromyxobacter sp.]
MLYVAYALAGLAILVMGYNAVLAVQLKRAIVGGEVGEKWGLLTALIVVFFACYLLSPLALYFEIPAQYLNLLVFGVFLFGAVFVWVVMGIIRDTLTFLKLIK